MNDQLPMVSATRSAICSPAVRDQIMLAIDVFDRTVIVFVADPQAFPFGPQHAAAIYSIGRVV